MDQYERGLDTLFQSLADPTRRAVIVRLGKGPASVTDLAQPFGMALPSFMKHIRRLEDSGLIRTHKRGRVRTCALEKARLAMVEDWMNEQRTLWEARLDRLEAFATKAMKEPTE